MDSEEYHGPSGFSFRASGFGFRASGLDNTAHVSHSLLVTDVTAY